MSANNLNVFNFLCESRRGALCLALATWFLVNWSLYKIVKKNSWNSFNKTEGFILAILNKKVIFQTQVYMLYIWFNSFIFKLKFWAYNILA
jgi:hypothetical protein